MTTRRDIFSAPVCALMNGAAADDPAQPSRCSLLVSYARCHRRTAEVVSERDIAEFAMWKRDEETCPIVERCDAALSILSRDMNQIARAAQQPARDIREAAAKLIMWRAETLLLGPRIDLHRDVFVFAAYRDVLKLAGFETFAHPLDAQTLAQAQTWDGE